MKNYGLPDSVYTKLTKRKWGAKTPVKKLTPYTVAKNELWEVCRALVFATYSHNGDVKCYTCPATGLLKQNRQLGHFIVGAGCPVSLYFDVMHLRPQCHRCNCHMSGNSDIFETKLREELGDEAVDELKLRRTKEMGTKWDHTRVREEIEKYERMLEQTKKLRGY